MRIETTIFDWQRNLVELQVISVSD